MPLFEYTAKDESGRRVQGMLQGGTWQDVDAQLKQRGLALTGISEVKGQPEPAPAPPSSSPTSPTQQAAPSSRPVVQPPVVSQPIVRSQASANPPTQATAATVAKTKPPRVRTRNGSDKQIMFLFTQIASYFQSGQSPAVAFTNLAENWITAYRPALLDMADAASAGQSVADEMQRYPNLFPPHVVGIYRAGEVGGFLPEACLSISNQAQESRRYKLLFNVLAFVFWGVIGGIPVAFWGARGLEASMRRIDATGGMEDGGVAVRESMGQTAIPVLIVTAIALLVTYGLYKIWTSIPLRPLRHRLTLSIPTVGKRARMESMALFSWVLSNLAKVGLSPRASAEIAASAAPNVHIANHLIESASRMRAETRLSDAIREVKMLTPEMQVMIQTGEMVGDLPRQLEMVAQAQRDDFLHYQKQTHFRVGCWAVLLMLAGTCLIGGWFQRMYYDSLFRVILGEGEQEVQSQP